MTIQQAHTAYAFADEAYETLLAKNRAAELAYWNASVLPHLANLLDLDPQALEDTSAELTVALWKQET